jgi:Zn-dependent protease
MLNKKEAAIIIAISLILGVTISLMKSIEIFLYTLLAVFLIIISSILAKKITSFYLDSEIEIELWEIKRYGFRPHEYFKRPFPAGAILPIITTAFSLGFITWMASLVFEVKPKTYRAAKRHGLYTFSEMTEYHIGSIASAGILVSIALAMIGYLINFPELAKVGIYYAFFNMIPISNLDGNKIYNGSRVIWSFLALITLMALIGSILII